MEPVTEERGGGSGGGGVLCGNMEDFLWKWKLGGLFCGSGDWIEWMRWRGACVEEIDGAAVLLGLMQGRTFVLVVYIGILLIFVGGWGGKGRW